MSDTDHDPISLRSEQLSVTIAPLGAELQRITTADARELLWDGDPAVWSGHAPILFPIIGELNGGEYRYDGASYRLPRHGFARRSRFTVQVHGDTAATFRLAANNDTRAVHPFEFALDITYTLTGAALEITTEITNLDNRPLPASLGFHPAFRWPLPFGGERGDHRLRFDRPEPATIRRLDADGLVSPTPHPSPVEGATLHLSDDLFTDDALIFDQLASRRVSYGADDGSPQLQVDFGDFPQLGVWTKPGAGFVCIEPWHGTADPAGFTGDIRDKPGIFLVPPGDVRRFSLRVSLIG